MIKRPIASFVVVAGLVAASTTAAGGAEIVPHRALYSMTLGSARNDSGVVDAHGTMDYEWGETCDGWTIEQRYRLKMRYGETPDVGQSRHSRRPSSPPPQALPQGRSIRWAV